jgi:transcriptional regulator with XRE-family HTH domain
MFYSLFIISKLFVTIQYFSGLEACGMDIGKRMKELRIQYGLTQQELADRSELTKGFISQLERNQNTPSIGTLLDIIQCLGTTPAEFFTDEEPEQIVFKNEDFFTKVNEDKHNIIEWVVPNAQKDSMEPVRLTLKAGGSSDIMQPHSGEEFGYLIKGTVKIYYGGKSHVLHAGESFYLKAGKKHYIENPGSRDAVLIWVSTPPSLSKIFMRAMLAMTKIINTTERPEPKFQLVPCINSCSITLPIRSTFPPPNRSEMTKEVSAGTKTMIMPLIMPDKVSGMMILNKMMASLAPRSFAASMTSFLILAMEL